MGTNFAIYRLRFFFHVLSIAVPYDSIFRKGTRRAQTAGACQIMSRAEVVVVALRLLLRQLVSPSERITQHLSSRLPGRLQS